jgi:hypothetical protein
MISMAPLAEHFFNFDHFGSFVQIFRPAFFLFFSFLLSFIAVAIYPELLGSLPARRQGQDI